MALKTPLTSYTVFHYAGGMEIDLSDVFNQYKLLNYFLGYFKDVCEMQ